MNMNILVAPNLNGKLYREFIPTQSIINTFLDFIDVDNGNLLLGSSNLNGRYWTGSVCLYKDFRDGAKFEAENLSFYNCIDTGVTDGKFVPKQNRIIVSQDSGAIKLYDIEEDNLKLMTQQVVEEHDEGITEISLWQNNKAFITSCADASIKIWQIAEDDMYCISSYNYAHANIVSSVNAHPIEPNLFVSASYDKTALLWDIREKKSATVIYEREFCALTKAHWHKTKTNTVAIGTSAGDVYIVDVRHPREFVLKNETFTRSIHNLCFNARDLLAVCCDDSQVAVMDVAEDMQTIYFDGRHRDFVRGLVWMDNILLSCAWDKQILHHYV